MLGKNVADFCPCSKNPPEAKLKGDWINLFGVECLGAAYIGQAGNSVHALLALES